MGAPRLQQDAVQLYQEQGYLLFTEPVLAPDQFQRLSALFEEIVAAHPEIPIDSLDTPHFHEPRLLEFLLDDAILDLVEPLIGPDFGLWSSHFIAKEAGTGRRTPWHEDSTYWQGRFDRFDLGIVTVWLAIDRSDRGNGCMKVLPGSHLRDGATYAAVDSATNLFPTEAQVDESEAVYFELEPNQCSLHDSRILHGAEANRSPRRRCGYTMRYFSQHMRFIPENNGGHKLWHCRGANPHNNPVENG